MGTYRAPRTVRTGYAYQPRPYRTYRVPWQPRWLAFEADPSAASRQTFAPAPGGAVRVLRAGTLHGSARVMALAPTATHNKVVSGKGSGSPDKIRVSEQGY